MILVTGATGTVGSEVVKQLAAAGAPVRALVRNAARAAAISGRGVEIAGGDLAYPEGLDAAFRGVRSVFLSSSPDPAMADLQNNAIQAAKRARVGHVVKVSAIAAASDAPSRLLRLHARVEGELKRSGLAWTILQPNFFMQNFLQFGSSIVAEGAFYAPAGDGKASLVDVRDVAAVSVAALTGEGHRGRTYVVTGPEALSHADAASKISGAIGRSVTYVRVPPEAARQGMISAGMPGWLAEELVALLSKVYARGVAAPVTSAVSGITGKPPRTFDQFVRDFAQVFAGSQSQLAH